MNPQTDEPQLRDIHLPDPISFWPPAPGWWVLLLVILMLVALAWFLRRRYQRKALHRQAQKSLQKITASWQQNGDKQALAQDLSTYLRRLSLSYYPRHEIAGLTGDAWLRWLDKSLPDQAFQHGAGRALITAPYSSHADIDGSTLLQLCERWILAQEKHTGTPP